MRSWRDRRPCRRRVARWLHDLSYYSPRLTDRLQRKPFLQARDCTEGLRVHLSHNVGPINGYAFQQAVNAKTLMCLRGRILCLLPKPQHSSFPTFFHLDEAVFASSNLKCLKYFHASSIRLADADRPFLRGHCTDVRAPCLRRIAPSNRLSK